MKTFLVFPGTVSSCILRNSVAKTLSKHKFSPAILFLFGSHITHSVVNKIGYQIIRHGVKTADHAQEISACLPAFPFSKWRTTNQKRTRHGHGFWQHLARSRHLQTTRLLWAITRADVVSSYLRFWTAISCSLFNFTEHTKYDFFFVLMKIFNCDLKRTTNDDEFVSSAH